MTNRFSRPTHDDHLAELGKLAGGLVHELKNPLGVILLNAEMVLEQATEFDINKPAQERLNKRLRRIQDSARSLQSIVQSFLAFSRPSRPDPDAVDLNALLEHILDEQDDFLKAKDITTAFHPDAGLPAITGDRQQLRSIFLNIITNAREALIERDAPRKLVVLSRAGKGTARIVIANNGPPIPARIAAHLFDPFMSGKDEGTGLGLAIVRRLVELHHGTVSASSDPLQGVSFTLEFPTDLGPAKARAELPLPEVEAVVHADITDIAANDASHLSSKVTPDIPKKTSSKRSTKVSTITKKRIPKSST